MAINFTWHRAVELPPQATGETFIDYERLDARILAERLRPYIGRWVLLTGGGGRLFTPCILRAVTIKPHYRCLRDARGWVVRTKKARRNGQDWIPLKDQPKIASVQVKLSGKGLPTHAPYIGSWRLLVPPK